MTVLKHSLEQTPGQDVARQPQKKKARTPAPKRAAAAQVWQSFACENCGRGVRYLYGRDYHYCTSYRCAAAVWNRSSTERRSRYRAEHRIRAVPLRKHLHRYPK